MVSYPTPVSHNYYTIKGSESQMQYMEVTVSIPPDTLNFTS